MTSTMSDVGHHYCLHGKGVVLSSHVCPTDIKYLIENKSCGNTSPIRWQPTLGDFLRLQSSISSPCTCRLSVSTSSFSEYSYLQLKSLLLALAIRFLSRLACTPIHETKARKSTHCGREDKVRWPYIIHKTRASANNVLAPFIHPPILPSFIHDMNLVHAAQPFLYPTAWARSTMDRWMDGRKVRGMEGSYGVNDFLIHARWMRLLHFVVALPSCQ